MAMKRSVFRSLQTVRQCEHETWANCVHIFVNSAKNVDWNMLVQWKHKGICNQIKTSSLEDSIFTMSIELHINDILSQ